MDDNTVRYQKAILILTRDNQDAWFRQVKLRLEAKNIFYVVEFDIVDVVGGLVNELKERGLFMRVEEAKKFRVDAAKARSII
ncbi:hypothetical protein E4U23_006468 [Claviceps purpurea]|nr:hypothetical protein E4U23_006468 [Claviceps purpurea]